MTIGFRTRERPLAPCALHAEGDALQRLLQALLAAPAQRLRGLRGVRAARGVVLLGAETDLPWADGVTYLGRDPRAPSLLLPTYLEPDVPVDLLERRITATQATPIAVLPHLRLLLGLGRASALDRDALARLHVAAAAAP